MPKGHPEAYLPTPPQPPARRLPEPARPIDAHATKADVLDRDTFSRPDVRRRKGLIGNPGRQPYDRGRGGHSPSAMRERRQTGRRR